MGNCKTDRRCSGRVIALLRLSKWRSIFCNSIILFCNQVIVLARKRPGFQESSYNQSGLLIAPNLCFWMSPHGELLSKTRLHAAWYYIPKRRLNHRSFLEVFIWSKVLLYPNHKYETNRALYPPPFRIPKIVWGRFHTIRRGAHIM